MPKKILMAMITALLPFQIRSEDLGKLIKTDPPVSRFVSARAGLNLREKPEQGAKKITTLPYRTEVMLIAEYSKVIKIDGMEGRWTQVRYSTNTVGWVFGGYLTDSLTALRSSRCLTIDELEKTEKFYLGGAGKSECLEENKLTFFRNHTGQLEICYESRGAVESHSAGFSWERTGNDVTVTINGYKSTIEEALGRSYGGLGRCFGACWGEGGPLNAEEQRVCDQCVKGEELDYGKLKTELDITILLSQNPGGVSAEYIQKDLHEVKGKKSWPPAFPLIHIGSHNPIQWRCFESRGDN